MGQSEEGGVRAKEVGVAVGLVYISANCLLLGQCSELDVAGSVAVCALWVT